MTFRARSLGVFLGWCWKLPFCFRVRVLPYARVKQVREHALSVRFSAYRINRERSFAPSYVA